MNCKWAIVYNNNSKSKEYMKIVDFIYNSFKEEKIDVELIKITSLKDMYISNDLNKVPRKIFFWDKNWDLAKKLKDKNFIIHENPENAKNCENKIYSLSILKKNKVFLPSTEILSIGQLKEKLKKEKNNKFPIVLKYSNSQNGSGVKIVYEEKEINEEIKDKDNNEQIVIQEYLDYSPNLLVKLFVTQNKIIAGMKVLNEKDGTVKYVPYNPTENEKNLAIDSCRIMGLNLAGVDIFYKEKDKPLICELNTQSNLLRVYNITGINVIKEFIKEKYYINNNERILNNE